MPGRRLANRLPIPRPRAPLRRRRSLRTSLPRRDAPELETHLQESRRHRDDDPEQGGKKEIFDGRDAKARCKQKVSDVFHPAFSELGRIAAPASVTRWTGGPARTHQI